MADQLGALTQSEQEVAAEAVAFIGTGAAGREAAAGLLYRRLGHRIQRYMMRNRVPEAEAEELLGDVIYKFITTDATGVLPNSAIALLWTIAERVLIDWARRKSAASRGGQFEGGGATEVSLDDETWLSLLDTGHGGFELPGWVKECVHRAAALFQFDKPRQAETLLLHAQGYSHRDLAVIQGADPDKVTPHQEKAAKSRVHHACKLAREYFKECKE